MKTQKNYPHHKKPLISLLLGMMVGAVTVAFALGLTACQGGVPLTGSQAFEAKKSLTESLPEKMEKPEQVSTSTDLAAPAPQFRTGPSHSQPEEYQTNAQVAATEKTSSKEEESPQKEVSIRQLETTPGFQPHSSKE